MYLKRITVAGFKSFATKTSIDFEPGIMAIVGPNGSGKSNLADAVRWALGEQNKGRLRLNDREEVVFAGTDKKARASLAEVTLLFDNEDGSFGLDLTEVEISRRLYRSGESEYKLAGRTARLSDIQGHLAEAGFGVGSYAVIGQGTIDNFIMSSPSERKLLFDEAAGIRGAELKREASMHKLTAVETNLVRLKDINAELAPRLASLAKSMASAKELEKLEHELKLLRQEFLNNSAAKYALEGAASQKRTDELTLELDRLTNERQAVEVSQAKRLQEASEAEVQSRQTRDRAMSLETERNNLSVRLADITGRVSQIETQDGQIELIKRRSEDVVGQLKDAHKKLTEIQKQLSRNNAADERAHASLELASVKVTEVQAELVAIRQEANEGTQAQYVRHALAILRNIAQQLSQDEAELESVRLLVHKAGRLLSHADSKGEAEILQRIRTAQEMLEKAMARREIAIEHQGNFTITRRSLELDEAHQEEAIRQLEPVLVELDMRLASHETQQSQIAKLKVEAEATSKKLESIVTELAQAQVALNSRSVDELQAITEEAGRLERFKNQEAVVKIELVSRTEQLALWQENLALLALRGQDWAMQVVPEEATKLPIELINQSLIELEAKVAARQQLKADTTVEYEEVSSRQIELAAQIQDLESGRENLLKLVGELDELIRAKFKANFAQLSAKFSDYFMRLFGGGSAMLELVEGEDGAYGIEIKASPKGKRLTSLTALSGGERALAGVALLASILSVNPGPFVVLDEIDAALDEANSGRLADILIELKAHSQLIVITHNRQTMHVARSLFGVTMNEHHASYVISMRLEEASALAAR